MGGAIKPPTLKWSNEKKPEVCDATKAEYSTKAGTTKKNPALLQD
jgi:hypothetical protein